MNRVSAAPPDLLRHAVELTDVARRREAAKALAQEFGAADLLIFVRDPKIDRSLPALGFPQTLRDGRAWQTLLAEAVHNGVASGMVTNEEGRSVSARAVSGGDGTALVLLELSDPGADLTIAKVLLPLIGMLLTQQTEVERLRTEVMLARQSATESSELATKLDLTRAEMQRALAIAESANRARDEFLATVSHELRTPLTSIIGWIQLVREESRPEVVSEALETIERNARAQSRLIEDILDFSRINAGKLRLDVRPIDLVDAIRAAVDVVRPAADAKEIRLDVVLDTNAGAISGDPDRLQQVIWNLLSNAVKFTPRGGRVQVRMQRANSFNEITVSDTGEGISHDFLPHVFDRFTQAESSSTRAHGGLGLGLAIVKHLVELHGGTVSVASPGLGQGATFTIHLPLIVARTQSASDVERSAELRDQTAARVLAGCTILVVEDNPDARSLLCAILTRAGARVETAENVAVALCKLENNQPDLIVSDIEMPGEDGYSFIATLRRREMSHRRIPAIALTAYTRSIDRVRALAAGFQMHMSKPVEPAELVAAVKSLVSATSQHH